MSEYLDLLKRNLNFRYLRWGNVVFLLGDWFNLIASTERALLGDTESFRVMAYVHASNAAHR